MYKRQIYNNTDKDLWSQKIQEIRYFRGGITSEKLPMHQANQLKSIYEKYRSVFSDEPGKVKNYQCKLKFRETVEFNWKAYPITHSRKEAERAEINKMIINDRTSPGEIEEILKQFHGTSTLVHGTRYAVTGRGSCTHRVVCIWHSYSRGAIINSRDCPSDSWIQ